jgi:glycine C-acetyltransferase
VTVPVSPLLTDLAARLRSTVAQGLAKSERVITSTQGTTVTLDDGRVLLNMCANNYLGLAADPKLVETAREALVRYGYGMASVRFICGTQEVHVELERRLSELLGTEDTILFSSCFDANTGLFEALLGEEDAVISDSLNHASIIDGIRLCKAQRLTYRNNDMADLERQLRAAADARFRLVATDGVFSMDGVIADLGAICDLAEAYGASVMVDDSHAVGFVGPSGAGTAELTGTTGRIDIATGTLGKALGGASGGYVSGRREIVEWLRQRARPYLFSNALAPMIAAASLTALDVIAEGSALRDALRRNATRFRQRMEAAGFDLLGAGHPIVPVLVGDAALASEMAAQLAAEGVYVVAFSYPVVPMARARLRVQLSAAHTDADVDLAVAAFTSVGRRLGVIPG